MAAGLDVRQNELRRQLATLAYAHVRPSGAAEAVQAASWWNALAGLGLRLPLFVVHDLGLLLARPPAARQVIRLGIPPWLLSRYETLLGAAAASDVVETLAASHLRDQTLAVLLARLVGDAYLRWSGRPRGPAGGDELPLVSPHYGEERGDLAREIDPGWAAPFLHHLCDQQDALLARLEQIDLPALRLLGLFAIDSRPQDMADLYQVVTRGAADVVDFSLQLLPSLLETKRRASVQLFSVDGYASVERRGHVDSILPGELAHDPEMFEQKALADDFLYYGHERQREGGRRLHYVLVDGSASMRGMREVFARGLALALAKKLALVGGGEVWLRFFDSRLHQRVQAGKGGGRELPLLLCFRSERGRNYARVFDQLASEVARLRREEGRDVAVTFITHGECHIPLATVDALARDAHLYAVFVLPSKPLHLDYLPRLHRYQVVTAGSIARAQEKRRRALEIVEDVAAALPGAERSAPR